MVDQVVSVVVNALVGVLSLALSAGAVYAVQWLKSHTQAQTLARAVQVGNLVVNAVEQAAAAGILKLPKKEAAVAWLRAWLDREGIHLTDAQIDAVIEAAVKALKDAGAELSGSKAAEDPQAKLEAARKRLEDAQAKANAAQAEVQAAQAALEQAKKEAAAVNGNTSA